MEILAGSLLGCIVTGRLWFLVQQVVNSWKDQITEESVHSFGQPRHLRFEPPLHQGHEGSCNVGRERCKQLAGYLLLSFLSQPLPHTSAKQILERLNHDLDALTSQERLLDALPTKEPLKETLLLSHVLE